MRQVDMNVNLPDGCLPRSLTTALFSEHNKELTNCIHFTIYETPWYILFYYILKLLTINSILSPFFMWGNNGLEGLSDFYVILNKVFQAEKYDYNFDLRKVLFIVSNQVFQSVSDTLWQTHPQLNTKC